MSVHAKQLKLSAQCFVQWLLKDNFRSSDLLRVDQVPEMMREPYVYTGYRPVYRSWKYYVHSILHLHNETMNIWTHFIGFFVILAYLSHFLNDFDVINDSLIRPVITFGICSLLSMVISTVAHLLHSKSPWHHHILFMLDYAAVAVYGFGIGMGSIYVTASPAFRLSCHHLYLPANLLTSAAVFFMYCTARVKYADDVERRKKLMIVSTSVHGLFLVAPLFPRYASCALLEPECSVTSLNHITLVIALDILCAVTFASLVPERWLPGRCDYFGHSHQIFHVVAVVTMVAKLSAMRTDMDTVDIPREIVPCWTTLATSLILLLLLDASIFTYFLHLIKSAPSCSKKSKIKIK